jgi:hypothetical protein
MTTPSTASRRRLAAVSEATWGTIPSSPSMLGIPYTTLKLDPTIATFDDSAIYGDRMQRYTVAGNQTVTGDIDVEMTPLTFDSFWASLMNGAWNSNVLKTGTTQSSITFEDQQLDSSVYTTFTGCMFDKLALTIPASGIVTGKWSVIGKAFAQSTTAIAGETFTAPTNAKPFIHNTGTFKLGGTVLAYFTAVSLNIDNKLNANMGLGSLTVQSITYGDSSVSGSVTVFFVDDTARATFIANTPTTLEFSLTNGTNTLDILLPNVVFKTSTRSSSKNGVITEVYNFVANYDSTTATNIQVTRT